MNVRFRAVTTVLTAAAITGAVLVAAAIPAAAAVPPWEPDTTDQIGQLRFYTAAGAEVTGGNLADDPNFKYIVATSDDPHTNNTSATLYGYTPVNGQLPVNWTGEQMSGTTTFPVVDVAAPAVVKNAGAHRPVVTMATTAQGAANIAAYIADVPNANGAGTGYENLYELRVKTAGNDPKYWAADIQVDTGAGTWTVVYPAVVTAHPSSLTIAGSATVNYGTSANLSTTLKDTSTNTGIVGAPVMLQRKSGANWVDVASVNTGAGGAATKSLVPTGKSIYRWFYAGNASHAAATSASKTVSVKQVVSAQSTKSSVGHGVAFKIYGTVKPASSGQNVTLQRQAGTSWNNIGTATIKSQKLPNGTTTIGFVFTVKQPAIGTFHYRVSKAATATLLAGLSITLTVKIT